MSRKRILLVGMGPWGQNYFKILRAHPEARAAGVVTRDPSRAGIPVAESPQVFSTFAVAIASEKWDGVILATPPELHSAALETCIKLGVPTLVEKPLCLELPTALTLEKLANDHATPVLVGHTYLFHPEYMRIREQVVATRARILNYESRGGNWGPFRNYSALMDYGAHDVAMALDLTGEIPASVRITEFDVVAEDGHSGGNYHLELEFKMFTAKITVGNRFPQRERSLHLQTEIGPLNMIDSGLSGPFRPLQAMLDGFLAGLDGHTDHRWGLRLAVDALRVLTRH